MEDAQGALSAQLSKFHLEYGRRAARPSVFWVNKPGESDQTRWISRPANDQRWSYLSFPGEIRNRIMEFALCPGDIYLPAKKYCEAGKAGWTSLCEMELRPTLFKSPLSADISVALNYLPPRARPLGRKNRARGTILDPRWLPQHRFKPPKPIENSQVSQDTERLWYHGKLKPSWQLLATCKQAYYEGDSFLYGLNVFHLATGDLRNSLVHLRKFREPTFGQLRKLCLDISLADLDLDVKNYTKMDFEIRRYRCPSMSVSGRHTLARHVLYTLRNLWASKLAYIRGIRSLDQVTINFNLPSPPLHRKIWIPRGCVCDTWVLRGNEISKTLRAIQPKEESFPLSAQGRIRHSRDSFYSGWDPEAKHWFIQTLRRAEKLFRDNVPEDGLRTFNPWLRGMAGDSYVGPDTVVRTRGANSFHRF